jgi:hypothetical protein
MTTFAEIKSRIASELHRTDLTTEIERAVKKAVQYYTSQRAYFNESSATFNTVANQTEYTTPATGIVELDLVTMNVNGRIQEITPKPWQELAAQDQTSWSGIPYYYGWRAESIRLYPKPNAIYTVTLYFVKEFDELSGDSDTNAWITDGEDLIVNRAKIMLYEGNIKATPNTVMMERSQERENLERIIRRTNQISGTGTLQSDM